jgi:hypothetical protein
MQSTTCFNVIGVIATLSNDGSSKCCRLARHRIVEPKLCHDGIRFELWEPTKAQLMSDSLVHVLLFVAMTTTPDSGELRNENLLMTRPDGYKTDFYEKTTDMLTSEMVPVNQSVSNWTQLLRTQIFFALKTTPAEFKTEMDKARVRICSEHSSRTLIEETENGYATSTWYDRCSLNAAMGSPEFSWFKGIQGNDSFYLVQVALKVEPTNEASTRWMEYLKKVFICDTRLPDRACAPARLSR